MILKKLDVQVNLTPQGYELGPRQKEKTKNR